MSDNSVKEWFNISEIADKLNFSRPTVYKKISTIDIDILRSLQKREKNITYYSVKVIDILKKDLSYDDITKSEITFDAAEDQAAPEEIKNYEEDYIQDLKSQIEFLKEQLRTKDDLILNHVKLIENEQVLRREQQKTYALMDEERARQVDEKLQAWRKEHFEEEKKDKVAVSGFALWIDRVFKK